MKHATTRMLFAYWDALRGERAAPERGEIEPGEIRHILADTFILELEASRRPEFRLAGTRLCALMGRELKASSLAELWGPSGAPEVGRFVDTVVDETAGVLAGLVGSTDKGHSVEVEMLLLPLRHRGKTHARLLGCLSCASLPTWIGLDPVTSLSTVSVRVIWPSGRVAAGYAPGSAGEGPIERRRRFIVHAGGLAQS